MRAEGDWIGIVVLSLAVDSSRVIRPVTEEAASLCVAPGSRAGSRGKNWG